MTLAQWNVRLQVGLDEEVDVEPCNQLKREINFVEAEETSSSESLAISHEKNQEIIG
jgi:hypothetical protein